MQTNETTKKKNEKFTPAADVVLQTRVENYKKILSKNKLLRDRLVQDYDELIAGILMLGEMAGIKITPNLKAYDLIPKLAVILEKYTESDSDLTGVQDLTKPSLKELLGKENLLKMTTNCIKIFETLDEVTEGGGDIQEANGNLWEFISDIAAAQGIELPEYEP